MLYASATEVVKLNVPFSNTIIKYFLALALEIIATTYKYTFYFFFQNHLV